MLTLRLHVPIQAAEGEAGTLHKDNRYTTGSLREYLGHIGDKWFRNVAEVASATFRETYIVGYIRTSEDPRKRGGELARAHLHETS